MSTTAKPHKIARISIVTNIPAPYRLPIYQRLDAQLGSDSFHVIFCSASETNREWAVEPSGFIYTSLKQNFLTWRGRYIHCNLDVIRVLRQLNPAVVITTGFNPTHLLAFGYTVFYNKIHIPMTDGTLASEQRLSVIHRIIRHIVYRHSKAFLGASLGSLKLYAKYGIDKTQCFQSHLCADNSAFRPSSQHHDRTFDLMFSGRFATEKNPIFALDVAAKVAKALNRKVSVLMLGSGPLLESARKHAESLSADIEVIFPGFVQQTELPEFYRSAKVFLFPSSWDPWGVVANEACAAGQAIIVSPHAGVANELVLHGQNGYVLELDLALWVKHAADLLNNQALLEQFSQDSTLKVQTYNYDAAAQGIMDAVLATGAP